MKFIDAYSHYCPPEFLRFMDEHAKANSPNHQDHVFKQLFENTPTLIDIAARLAHMEKYNIDKSVLVPLPWIESVPAVLTNNALANDAAELCNSAMAKVRTAHPNKFFVTGVLPCHDGEQMLEAFDRIIFEHKLNGAVIFVGPEQKPLDHPDYLMLFERAAKYDMPIWIHPCRPPTVPDYKGETLSKYMIWQSLGWVFDSSCAMIRLAMTGIFDEYPLLKIITHHHGAMIPIFSQRMDYSLEFFETKGKVKMPNMPKRPLSEHLKHFYCDTASHSYEPLAIQQAIEFFGEDKVLFGTDAPMDVSGGDLFTENAQRSIADLNKTDNTKENIRYNNVLKLLTVNN